MTGHPSGAAVEWRIADAAVGYVAAMGMSVVTASAAIGGGASDDGLAVFLAGQVGFWVVLVGTMAAVSRLRGTGSLAAYLGMRATVRDAVVGFPVGVAAQLVALPVLYLPLQLLVDDLDLDGPARDVLDRGGGWGLPVLAVAVVVVAPVVEEVFFRGLLLGAFRDRWGVPVAIAASSVVFGVTHFQPLQFPGLTLAGLVFAVLAVRAGRLGPAIWAHAGFNAATVVVLVASG